MCRTTSLILLVVGLPAGPALSAAVATASDETRAPGTQWTETLKITIPYVPGEMPTARELLDKSLEKFAEAGAWTADVELHITQRESPAETSYRGKLSANGNRLRVELESSMGEKDQRLLVVADPKGIEWSEWRSDDGIRIEKRSLDLRAVSPAGGADVDRLPSLDLLAGPHKRRREWLDAYTVDNRGASEIEGAKVYVLQAVVADKSKVNSRNETPSRTTWAIVISAEDTLPVIISSVSGEARSATLMLHSYVFDTQIDDAQFVYTPPEGAQVVDIDAAVATGKDKPLENPVPYAPESIARGKRLYLADCVVCHSVDGTGRDSDVTDNAADLTDTEYWLSDGSDGATFLAIRDGAGDEMPGYKDDYRDAKMIWDLVNYIKSLQKAQ